MCMICAAIPATAALGSKLNADQLQKPEAQRRPIFKLTSLTIVVLLSGSILYHTLLWQN